MNTTAYSFLAELGQKIPAVSGDDREQLSVPADFCFNTALQRYLVARELYGGELPGSMAIYSVNLFYCLLIFFIPSGTPTEGLKIIIIITRKLCYCKDDRAMRPIHGALKIFGTP